MKKGMSHALVIFLIVVFIALIPTLFGVLFKYNYLNLIAAINQDQRVNIEVLEYHQGWLTSTAKVKITLHHNDFPSEQPGDAATGLNGALTFVLDEHIIHGPIIYDKVLHQTKFGYAMIESELHLAQPLEAALLGKGKDDGILQFSLLANFDGDWHGQLQFPIMTFYIQNIGRLIWYGLNGDFKIIVKINQVKHVVVAMQIGSIIMLGDAQNSIVNQLNINPLTYDYDTAHESSGLWSGNTTIYTPGIYLKRPDGSMLTLKEVNINSSFGMTSKTFYNTNVALNIEHLDMPGAVIAQLSQVHVMLSANDFSSQYVNEYLQFFKSMTKEEIMNLNASTLQKLLIHTVIPSSYFYVDASANTSLGVFSAHAKISWKPKAPLPNSFADVIANSETTIDVTASTPMVEKIIEISGSMMKDYASKKAEQTKVQGQVSTPPATTQTDSTSTSLTSETPKQLISDMLLGGYLSKEQEGYSTTLTIENGVWKIRGRAISPTK